MIWDREVKGRPGAFLRLYPNLPLVPFRNFLANREADAGTLVLTDPVQALEHLEYALAMTWVNAYTVVAN